MWLLFFLLLPLLSDYENACEEAGGEMVMTRGPDGSAWVCEMG